MWRVIFDISDNFNNIFSRERLAEGQLTAKALAKKRSIADPMVIEDAGSMVSIASAIETM